jgi:hypothetical protein
MEEFHAEKEQIRRQRLSLGIQLQLYQQKIGLDLHGEEFPLLLIGNFPSRLGLCPNSDTKKEIEKDNCNK